MHRKSHMIMHQINKISQTESHECTTCIPTLHTLAQAPLHALGLSGRYQLLLALLYPHSSYSVCQASRPPSQV